MIEMRKNIGDILCEYGEKDLCIGVPCILGRNGIEKIVEFDLNDEEKELFAKSAAAVHNTNAALA